MNISELHDSQKEVSAKTYFKAQEGNVIALQILKDAFLKEHITKVPAILLCVSGEVLFENEKGIKQILTNGDFIHIDPQIVHSVRGEQESQLLLIK